MHFLEQPDTVFTFFSLSIVRKTGMASFLKEAEVVVVEVVEIVVVICQVTHVHYMDLVD